ncbi:winged helix-turn-helix transcriptional regulator [Sphingobium phenoxybenzoativorans]|uniref:winged helix-turn-helix transcriptional regulator n=1 Tax=Sphingobium phenoxybenzoativorans TaxID=1592790 RepID=UPI001C0D1279
MPSHQGTERFSELRRAVGGISEKMLIGEAKELRSTASSRAITSKMSRRASSTADRVWHRTRQIHATPVRLGHQAHRTHRCRARPVHHHR